jgi:hypothetical protein
VLAIRLSMETRTRTVSFVEPEALT